MIHQQAGERNFHFFYQLLSVLSDGQVEKTIPEQYRYIFEQVSLINDVREYSYLSASPGSEVTTLDGKNFQNVFAAMEILGFGLQDIETMFFISAAILHLGNVQFSLPDFEDSIGANELDLAFCVQIESYDPLHHFCRLLKLNEKTALQTLCRRQYRCANQVFTKVYSNSKAVYGRDALAKTLYERLFTFISNKINVALKGNLPSREEELIEANIIGILDIYGFEVLSQNSNSFEQFLINFCNEKLHQLFVDTILNKEQQVYKREDIEWVMVDFEDNLSICQLMDDPNCGMFTILDDASVSTLNYDDRDLLNQFNYKLSDNEHYQSRRTHPQMRHLNPETDFIVRHFAGDVCYSVVGFKDKNMDSLLVDYKRLMHTSGNPTIQSKLKI